MNIDVTAIVTSATILTLVIGLALQDTAANLVSAHRTVSRRLAVIDI